jgi:uncharacterized membrane protein
MLNYFKTLNFQKLNKLLGILILIYIVLVFGICFFKYFTFDYNGLDLAIYNQVFYNSSLGNFFQFTIHPTSYLGDHLELLIFFLVPFYAVFKSPLTLLLIQILFISLAAIPLYLIAKKYLKPLPALLIFLLYLFNPATININIFEFHILALVPFFIFWTFYFYDQNKFWPFLGLSFLSLLMREDVAFVIFMFGIIALLDKKKLKWILTPIILSSTYFFLALKIISYFSSANKYKFLIYYKWLGQTPLELFTNFFLKFPLVLKHVLTIANFELILGFLLVFLFIPLYQPKYLLLSLGMFMQIILGPTSGELILKTHYGSIFLAAFSLATIFSLSKLLTSQKFLNFWQKYKDVVILILVVGFVYNFLVLGPLIPLIKGLTTTDYQEVKLKKEFLQEIPKNASLATTFDLIANLSSRPKLYSLHYLFLGKEQYMLKDFPIPADLQYILINFEDFSAYSALYEKSLPEIYYQGDDNLRKLLAEKNFKLIKAEQNLGLWQKNSSALEISLYQIYDKIQPKIENLASQNLNSQIEFLGSNKKEKITSLYFQALTKIEKNYFIQINDGLYPLGYGLYPTSEWRPQQIIELNFFNLPPIKNARILNSTGGLELNGLGSNYVVWDKKEILGEINLN